MAFIRYISYGGMNSGTQVNNEEFLKVAEEIDDIAIPENVKIFALGEATHGNKEFQELKLDLFRKMVEEYNCKAFALEADYGGCLLVNQYIHGEGKNTEDDAVEALAFHIYQTDEMRALIRYMADYNKQAKPEEMLSFYGFDMQNSDLDQKCVDEAFSELKMQYTDMEDAAETLKNIPGMEMYAQAARCYLQNQELSNASNVDYTKIRDHYMAENIDWIYEHVQKANESMLMISGHNGHVAKKSTYTTFMGEELFENMVMIILSLAQIFTKQNAICLEKMEKELRENFILLILWQIQRMPLGWILRILILINCKNQKKSRKLSIRVC